MLFSADSSYIILNCLAWQPSCRQKINKINKKIIQTPNALSNVAHVLAIIP